MWSIRIGAERLAASPAERLPIEGALARHEQIDLEHRGKVNQVERAPGLDRRANARFVDVVGTLQAGDEGFDVLAPQVRHDIHVQAGAGDAMRGAGERATDVMGNTKLLKESGHGRQRIEHVGHGLPPLGGKTITERFGEVATVVDLDEADRAFDISQVRKGPFDRAAGEAGDRLAQGHCESQAAPDWRPPQECQVSGLGCCVGVGGTGVHRARHSNPGPGFRPGPRRGLSPPSAPSGVPLVPLRA